MKEKALQTAQKRALFDLVDRISIDAGELGYIEVFRGIDTVKAALVDDICKVQAIHTISAEISLNEKYQWPQRWS